MGMLKLNNSDQLLQDPRSSIIHLVLIASLAVIFVAWGIISYSSLHISSVYGSSVLFLISLCFICSIFSGRKILISVSKLKSIGQLPNHYFKEKVKLEKDPYLP